MKVHLYDAVYEAFSEAVIGLAEVVLCITREAARQHLGDWLAWKRGVRMYWEEIRRGVRAAFAAAHFFKLNRMRSAPIER
jgi:hypothetical protein